MFIIAQPNYSLLNKKLSDTQKAHESEICWREFLVALNCLTVTLSSTTEEEIADITKSLEDWRKRRKNTAYQEKNNSGKLVPKNICVGDICLADLGLNYNNECSYFHPVLVIEKIEDFLIVVPTSTTFKKIEDAYNFDTKEGKWYYVKVGKELGFDEDCVLILDNIKSISQGRIIKQICSIKENIMDKNSLFYNVKMNLLTYLFPQQVKEYYSLQNEYEKLSNKYKELENSIRTQEQENKI